MIMKVTEERLHIISPLLTVPIMYHFSLEGEVDRISMPLNLEPEAKESKFAQVKAVKACGCTASNKV
ncbi:hypothetical protein ABEX25_19935 [Paenibacillus thiaminolyticus]|uniref:hypothetical protein n=1 Tax=Paenibacillus thiaminolyticus TaxID=49283 RepID=UPI003D2B4F65